MQKPPTIIKIKRKEKAELCSLAGLNVYARTSEVDGFDFIIIERKFACNSVTHLGQIYLFPSQSSAKWEQLYP